MLSEDPRTPDRIAMCGWYTRDGNVEVRSIHGSVYTAQLIVCARPWVEPVCSAKIRRRKGAELENLIRTHQAAGGAVTLLTLTSGEHHLTDLLEESLTLLRKGWSRMIHSTQWKRGVAPRCGILGVGASYEFTWGWEHGHHPHMHDLLFHRAPLDAAQIVDVHEACWEQFGRVITQAGRYLHPRHGIRIDANADEERLAGYVTKVQEGDWTVAQEMTRGDVKRARADKGRTPFDILRDHYLTGDLADWELWQEYCQAVMLGGGRSIPVFRLTPGLRKKILGDSGTPVLTDEQLALVEVGGQLVCTLARQVWVRVRQAHAVPALLAAGEAGGIDGINAMLAESGFGWADPPEVSADRKVREAVRTAGRRKPPAA